MQQNAADVAQFIIGNKSLWSGDYGDEEYDLLHAARVAALD